MKKLDRDHHRTPNYKPVRIINPTGKLHTARVYPCQSLLLKLRKPSSFLECGNDAKFVVSLFSEYLIIEEVETDVDTGDEVYKINQKYDMGSFTQSGELLLGEINIKLPDGNFKSTICVIQNGNPRIITAINPMGHTIKVEPHQTLELICFDEEWEEGGKYDEWEGTVTHSSANIQIEQSKYEVLPPHVIDINPRLDDLSKMIVRKQAKQKPVREHHWWYSLTESTLKKVSDMSNDIYTVGNIDTEGRCVLLDGTYQTNWRSLDVRLAVRGKNKYKMHPYHLNPNSVEHKLEIIKRSEIRGILTNPLSTEQIDFYQGFEEIVVEIIQPNMYWSDLEDKIQWEIRAEKNVKIVPMSDYFRWGKMFQRFRITHDYVSKTECETKFLGAVHIVCKEKQDHHDGRKRLGCWLTPVKDTVPVVYSAYVPTVNYSQWGKKKDKDYDGTPKVCNVEFQELEVFTLVGAAKTRRLSDIFVSTHTAFCNYSDLYDCKKKPTTYHGGSRSNSNDKPPEKPKDSKVIDFIIFNPQHLQRIVLEYGQALIIRMSAPQKVLGSAINADEQWALIPESNGDAMKLEYFRSVKISEAVYQEAKIVVDKIPPITQIHSIGTLKFTCAGSVRAVFVMCNVTDAAKVEKRPDIKIVQPNKCFEGVNGRRLYISDWAHNDGVIVDPNETFYVRSPGHISKWTSKCWHMEIEQYSLPDSVWRHPLLKDVLKDIELDNPWFRTSMPLQLASTYVFRPLTIQQPHIQLILRAVTSSVNVDVLPIAKLTFRNDDHPSNEKVSTPYGVIECRMKLERTLNLCLSLLPYRELVLDNPKDHEEIRLVGQNTLIVKLKSKYMSVGRGTVKNPWYIGPFPPFLDFKGMQEEKDGTNVFKFKVRQDFGEVKDNKIRFICGDSEKTLFAKYEKCE